MKSLARKVFVGSCVNRASAFAALVWLMLASTGCWFVSPQVVREIQTAKPLEDDQTQGSVSGGVSWDATGVRFFSSPAIPNVDLNLLLRRGRQDQKEIQLTLNLSARLGLNEEGWGVHAAMGVFFKKSTLVSSGQTATGSDPSPEKPTPADEQETDFWTRPLYKAWIVGPTAGVYFSRDYPFMKFQLAREQEDGLHREFEPRARPFVSPFAGLYLRYMNEKRKDGFVRLRGLLISVNYYILDHYLFHEHVREPVLGLEVFLCGFAGSERRKFLSQFYYGIGTDRMLMPRLVFGITFGSKGRQLGTRQ